MIQEGDDDDADTSEEKGCRHVAVQGCGYRDVDDEPDDGIQVFLWFHASCWKELEGSLDEDAWCRIPWVIKRETISHLRHSFYFILRA